MTVLQWDGHRNKLPGGSGNNDQSAQSVTKPYTGIFIANGCENSDFIAISHTLKPSEACAIPSDDENLLQSA
jgi:hypothetical protein